MQRLFRAAVFSSFLACLVTTEIVHAGAGDDSYVVQAVWFDRGNAVSGSDYADRYPCIINGGQVPNQVEYDLDFPAPGRYKVEALYAAAEVRPVELAVNGQKIATGLNGSTGSWATSSAVWSELAEISVERQGNNTIALTATSIFPHISALRFTPIDDSGAGWSLPRRLAREKATGTGEGGFKPNAWNGGWFLEVAADRFAKKESGRTFSDHFATETSWALVPRESLSFEISTDKIPEIPEEPPCLNDELTYTAGMFEPLSEATDDVAKTIEQRGYHAIVRIDPGETEAFSRPKSRQDIPLSPDKYEELVARSGKLIETYRRMDGVPKDFLEDVKRRLDGFEKNAPVWRERFRTPVGPDPAAAQAILAQFFDEYIDLARLYSFIARSNPLLDFQDILFVKRHAGQLGLPQNWQSNSVLPRREFDDTLMVLRIETPDGTVETPRMRKLYKPGHKTFLGDLDLHFDAEKAIVSMCDEQYRWNVFELDLAALENSPGKNGPAVALLPPMDDANHYDACYLADDSLMFTSTMPMTGVPCVNGSTPVTNMYRKYNDGTIRRLTFEQDHNWCPVLMPDGRVLYQRWEYTDIPHAHSRLLFLINPDGTMQTSFYGTNSYWPNSLFYARPIPEDPSKFVAIVGGHHGVPRMGELVLFDVRKGRTENHGAVERICGAPKRVESKTDPKYDSTLIVDNLVDESWPKYLHPFPINEDYYLVSAQPNEGSLWGLYLVDRNENMTLLAETEGFALFEPVPWKKTRRPPDLIDRRDDSRQDATLHISDIYFGEGLKGVPRGTVKNLRIISYNFLYPNVGGPQGVIGMEGPWDFKTILGTVPVQEDGSAAFSVPANTPISLQPLDENGQAVQLMRSWLTAMPGETLTCSGCHEDRNQAPPMLKNLPSGGFRVSDIEPWYGPARGFAFAREVQPVLDHYCIDCHDGAEKGPGIKPFDLRGLERLEGYTSAYHAGYPDAGHFSTSYYHLHPYVRRPGMESDYVLLNPMEFSANTTELVQILRNGHYGLQMDAEAWDRIITWIDLNAPYHGTQGENMGEERIAKARDRRFELMKLYANLDDKTEEIVHAPYLPERAGSLLDTGHSIPFSNPFASREERETLKKVAAGARFPSGRELRERWLERIRNESSTTSSKNVPPTVPPQGETKTIRVNVAENLALDLTRISRPKTPDGLDKGFWLGTHEITNGQFEAFDPSHDSRVESRFGMQFGVRGFYVNAPELPVVRVSWNEAVAFCDWLSEKTGKKFRLPSEEEWEYAARAGTETDLSFGNLDDDFSRHANLADKMLSEFVCHPYFKDRRPMEATVFDDWIPKIEKVNDGGFLSVKPGSYQPNPWGLYDMHGNAAEWTATKTPDGKERIVRGGSWHDRPYRAASGFKTGFLPWQRVFDVGFRVLCEEP